MFLKYSVIIENPPCVKHSFSLQAVYQKLFAFILYESRASSQSFPQPAADCSTFQLLKSSPPSINTDQYLPDSDTAIVCVAGGDPSAANDVYRRAVGSAAEWEAERGWSTAQVALHFALDHR